jgi:rod shape-determining protein MreB
MKLFRKLGIDLGTANSVVWEAGVGIVLDEPTVVAVGIEDRKVLAVGNEAKLMLGKHRNILKSGVHCRMGWWLTMR